MGGVSHVQIELCEDDVDEGESAKSVYDEKTESIDNNVVISNNNRPNEVKNLLYGMML